MKTRVVKRLHGDECGQRLGFGMRCSKVGGWIRAGGGWKYGWSVVGDEVGQRLERSLSR